MVKRIEVKILPKDIDDLEKIKAQAIQQSNIDKDKIWDVVLAKRSIDARSRQPVFRLQVDLYIEENAPEPFLHLAHYQNRSTAQKKCIIIGAGPAGYFAALELIELGIQPIIFERGKNVRERRRDLKAIQIVNAVDIIIQNV